MVAMQVLFSKTNFHCKTSCYYSGVLTSDPQIDPKILLAGESNSGLSRDSRVYWPLYEGGWNYCNLQNYMKDLCF